MRRRAIFIYFLFIVPLFCADFNVSIAGGTIKTYQTLKKEIISDANKSDENNLQEALIDKLIKLSEQKIPADKNITYLPNQDNYQKLFDNYIQNVITKSKLKSIIAKESNKLKILKKEIKDLNKTTLTQELFYAFYLKDKNFTQKKLTQLQNSIDKIQKKLISGSKEIFFDKTQIQKMQDTIDKNLKKISTQIEQSHIKQERHKLLNQTDKIKTDQKRILDLKNQQQDLYQKKLAIMFLKFTTFLQRKDNHAFDIQKNITTLVKTKFTNSNILIEDLDALLTKMEKNSFGTVAAMKGKGVEEIYTQIDNLWQIANRPLFTINKTKVSIFKLIISLIIFILGFIIGNFYKKQIKNLSLKNRTITSSTRTLLSNLEKNKSSAFCEKHQVFCYNH